MSPPPMSPPPHLPAFSPIFPLLSPPSPLAASSPSRLLLTLSPPPHPFIHHASAVFAEVYGWLNAARPHPATSLRTSPVSSSP
ncbi:hypothetical protein CHLRE_09g402293v5 [Chlamydomonas reinhardtii]|uniref:Uncharacterized protein n=1 Tax=Chlamydomonas reinhardtii TaxID=3055 RepID=A0A2K3DF36_CHLRE|nr:uncharacterized protein CHLRE_09g402293v5 [Chlamydomonas reinhardtii]PNW79148.1 hypothetical protein CHLRE_09g402293v5 [Chlamydomonas reinhardtii]